jgi:hypothetical protein
MMFREMFASLLWELYETRQYRLCTNCMGHVSTVCVRIVWDTSVPSVYELYGTR